MSTVALNQPGELLTIGQIVDRTGASHHRVEYVIASRNISADQRAGRYRLFGPAAFASIQAALNATSGGRAIETASIPTHTMERRG